MARTKASKPASQGSRVSALVPSRAAAQDAVRTPDAPCCRGLVDRVRRLSTSPMQWVRSGRR